MINKLIFSSSGIRVVKSTHSAWRMESLFKVLLFSLGVLSAAAQSELICSHQPITALAGDDVILPCKLQPPISASAETVEWTRPDLDPKYIHVHRDGRLMYELQNPSYFYRTRIFADELQNGNVSMKIFDVKTSDAGRYKCFLPSMQKEAHIKLIVGESEVIGSHEPVKAAVGDDVILPCRLEPPFDVRSLTVEWKHNGEDVHLYQRRRGDPAPQDESFSGRTSLFHDEMVGGNISLKLSNVTERDAGEYSCFVPKLHSQVRRGFVSLTVGGDGEISTVFVIAMVVIPTAALAALAAVFAALRRKPEEPTEQSNVSGTQQSHSTEDTSERTLELIVKQQQADDGDGKPHVKTSET